MTGDAVHELRLALGVSATDLAEVLGVGPNSVPRWESAGREAIYPDPRNRELLDLLALLVERRTPEQARSLGRRVRLAIAERGGLYALHRILALAFVAEHDALARHAEAP